MDSISANIVIKVSLADLIRLAQLLALMLQDA